MNQPRRRLARPWASQKPRCGDHQNRAGARLLETPIGEEEDSHLGDFIQDEDAPAPADAASNALMKELLWDVLDSLTPREAKVLRLRFGLMTATHAPWKKSARNSPSPGAHPPD